MKKTNTKAPVAPVDVISSIFTARRDLLLGVKSVVAGSGLTVEQCDLLVSLFGVRELAWGDLPHDEDGFVAFKELERFLVHNPSLLSRRLNKMLTAKPPLVEIAKAGPGQHFNALRVRIAPAGVERIRPVWERYARMSANLLQDIPQSKLAAHCWVNEEISKRIRARREAASDFSK